MKKLIFILLTITSLNSQAAQPLASRWQQEIDFFESYNIVSKIALKTWTSINLRRVSCVVLAKPEIPITFVEGVFAGEISIEGYEEGLYAMHSEQVYGESYYLRITGAFLKTFHENTIFLDVEIVGKVKCTRTWF